MTYNSVIYLVDNNLFYKKKDRILNLSFKSDIVFKIEKKHFIKEYQLFLKYNKISRFVYNKTLLLIHNSTLSKHDLDYLKNLFYEIGYKEVILKSDITFLKISKKNSYLIIGQKDRFLFIDNYNQKKQIVFDKSCITINEEINIIQKRIKKHNLFIIGKVNENLLKTKNYYVIENKEKFILDNYI